MTYPRLEDDDVLLTLLGAALHEVDPVPARAVAAAVALSDLGDADGELASLVADSLVDSEVMLFRHDLDEAHGMAAARLVTFATSELTIDLDLQPDGATLVGVISPAMQVEVEVQTTGATQIMRSDELGRFNVRVGPGRCRLRVHTLTGQIITPWVTR